MNLFFGNKEFKFSNDKLFEDNNFKDVIDDKKVEKSLNTTDNDFIKYLNGVLNDKSQDQQSKTNNNNIQLLDAINNSVISSLESIKQITLQLEK